MTIAIAEIKGWGSGMYNGTSTPSLYFGARTIWSKSWKTGRVWLDFVPDRKEWAGSLYEEYCGGEARLGFEALKERAEFKHFIKWIHDTAIPELVQWVNTLPGSGSPAVFEIVDSTLESEVKYHLRASPNASYGYVYIAAWRT